MRMALTTERGLSLVEVTIMLMVLSVLSAVMSPVIGDYVNDARHVKAAGDVQVLAATFSRFAVEARTAGPGDQAWDRFEVLVGEGLAPGVAPGVDEAWLGEPDRHRVGLLEDHLITNVPGYLTARTSVGPWCPRWRGPYVSGGIGPDPWGNRYAINVAHWSRGSASLVVLSAGPNGLIETPFAGEATARGGDDVIAVIGSGGQS